MNSPTRVGGFLVGLGAVFGIALFVGSQVGAVAEPPPTHDDSHKAMGQGDMEQEVHGSHGSAGANAESVPGGLMVSDHGYTLALTRTDAPAGDEQPVSFVIEGPDGAPVTDYDVRHEKELHFIAVRRDFNGFQHVHPTRDADGTWSTTLDLTPGQWRLFADFAPRGAEALTLGADLTVAGTTQPRTPLPVSRSDTVDGYTVQVEGDLTAGEHSMLTLSVSRSGEPVTDLEPYLGAYGHLVALREGDLAYLHVHPDGEPGDGETRPGPDVVFGAEVPSPARYHLYLDFKHDGVVRTAEFVLDAEIHEGG